MDDLSLELSADNDYHLTDESFEVAANSGSTIEDQCLSCYAGWYFQNTHSFTYYNDSGGESVRYQSGQCEPCHCSCSACTGPGAHECIYCYDDRSLTAATIDNVEGDYCLCKKDSPWGLSVEYRRSDNLLICSPDCPIGMNDDSINGYCQSGSNLVELIGGENTDNRGRQLEQNNIPPLPTA
jgi:hypothetical protein